MQDTYCASPFVHIALHCSVDRYRPCCSWIDVDGNGPSGQHPDPMSSDFMHDLRTKMLAGEHITGCQKCYDNEAAKGRSMRIGMNETYGRLTDVKLRYIEMNFGNLCNLKCRMCGSGSSSKWIADEIKMGLTPQSLVRRRFRDINVDWSNIDSIKLIGGEPSLEQDHIIDLLDHIRQCRGSLDHLTLEIFTNGMVLFNYQIMQAMRECRLVDFNVSIDGIRAYNDYQRSGSDWDVVWQNTLRYYELSNDKFQLSISSAVGIYTITHFIDFVEMVARALPRAKHLLNPIYHPEEQHMGNLPDWYKQQLIDLIESWEMPTWKPLDYSLPYGRTNYLSMKAMLLHLLRAKPVTAIEEVRKHTRMLDSLRDESILHIDRQLYRAIFDD